MLWTLDGLCLLAGLGVVGGACFILFATAPEGKGWRQWMLAPGVAAICGALYLIIEWLSPAGGGGG